jgi:hypothetical protein
MVSAQNREPHIKRPTPPLTYIIYCISNGMPKFPAWNFRFLEFPAENFIFLEFP